jgi:FkbM family methyltransferase
MNALKVFLFRLYCAYFNRVPFPLGKYRMVQLLRFLFSGANFDLGGYWMELHPFAQHDRYLISGYGYDSIVSEIASVALGRGGLFLDIGANAGYFSLFAAKLPGVQVLAFEPSPRELQKLYRNISLNRFNNITVYPYGLADGEATIPLKLSSDSIPVMNSVLDITPSSESVPCCFYALDQLVPAHLLSQVKFCKIDVEGFEISVLRGMAGSMSLLRDCVFVVEISPSFLAIAGQQAGEIYRFFSDNGYKARFGLQDEGQWNEVFEPIPVKV